MNACLLLLKMSSLHFCAKKSLLSHKTHSKMSSPCVGLVSVCPPRPCSTLLSPDLCPQTASPGSLALPPVSGWVCPWEASAGEQKLGIYSPTPIPSILLCLYSLSSCLVSHLPWHQLSVGLQWHHSLPCPARLWNGNVVAASHCWKSLSSPLWYWLNSTHTSASIFIVEPFERAICFLWILNDMSVTWGSVFSWHARRT